MRVFGMRKSGFCSYEKLRFYYYIYLLWGRGFGSSFCLSKRWHDAYKTTGILWDNNVRYKGQGTGKEPEDG
ncbi:hypothetical protein ABH899_003939 [Paenibacillus sp. RC84]